MTVSITTQTPLLRPRRRAVWAVLITAVAMIAAIAVVAGRTILSEGQQAERPDLQRVLDELVTGRDRIAPGVTAYVSGPQGTWLGSAGIADVKSGEAMRPDARVRLESVSKIYTASLVLRLAEEGKLRVDDTVEAWLPGLLPYGNRITIRQLLTMTSGLIDTNDITRKPTFYLARVRDAKLQAELAAIVKRATENPVLEVSSIWWIRLAAWQPLLFTPGTQSHYSNIGYEVLGLIAADAGGKPLPVLHRERLFEPLGLRQTAYDPQGPIAGTHARGYSIAGNGKLTDTTERHGGVGAGGGIVSNAEETATFLTALMRGRLLGRAQLEAMKGDSLWLGGEPSVCAGPAYGWSGGGNGYKTNVWVNGDGTRVAVLLLNARLSGSDQPVADQTAGAAMRALYCAVA